ncbi:mechanosensitive ion channel family protein [Gordonia crocea]|uniref:mechanosensitive ion channel family protein n=1 Tax=Gordonia crocea TaxID=589162 RepID=UPI001E2AFF91|nr:mechanosensitive ion channel family protein [Gordonia crocea]
MTRALERAWDWLSVTGLAIALWVIGAILVARLIGSVLEWFEHRVTRQRHDEDAIVLAEDAKHRRAVLQVIRWVAISLIAFIAGLRVLALLGVPVSGLIGPGAVIGAALGFGAQRVVQDVLAGFFVVTEKQYGYGDRVRLVLSGGAIAEGLVEDITLRATRLRSADGELITVPNGQVLEAVNRSRDWARAVVDITVGDDADLAAVNDQLTKSGEAFFADKRYAPLLLDAPVPLGVTEMGTDTYTVRVVARTQPGRQFDVSSALRGYLMADLRRADLGWQHDQPPAGREVE